MRRCTTARHLPTDGQVEETSSESCEFVDEHVEPENESYDREQASDEESAPYEDGQELFEQFAPVVSQADLRTRIDDYFAAAEVGYTLPAGNRQGTVAVHLQQASGPQRLRSKLERALGSASSGSIRERSTTRYTAARGSSSSPQSPRG